MVVQVQAAITQRRGGPTTVVTRDAWMYSKDTQKGSKKYIKNKTFRATAPYISKFPIAVNHRYRHKACHFVLLQCGLLLCANLYSVDWLDGQSTWPIYANERLLLKLSCLMTRLKLHRARAINCTTMSNVNSFSLVFSIFCEAWYASNSLSFPLSLAKQHLYLVLLVNMSTQSRKN